MTKKTIEWDSVGADKVVRDHERIAKSEKQLADEAEKASKKAEKAAQDVAKAQGVRAEATKNLMLGLIATAGALVTKGGELVNQWARVEQNQGRLQNALRKTNDAADDVDAAFARAIKTMEGWEEFGATVDEQTVHLERLINTTGNAEEGLSALKLAIDLNAQSGLGLERSVDAINRVYAGEVDHLKDLGVLTRDQASALSQVTDEGDRAAKALGALNAQFAGGAESNKGLADNIDEAAAKLERMETAVGRTAAAIGNEATGLTSQLAQMLGVIDEDEDILENLARRLENIANIAERGDWERLAEVVAPAVGLLNPFTSPAALAALGYTTATETGKGPAAPVNAAGSNIDRTKIGQAQAPVGPMDDLEKALNASAEDVAAFEQKGRKKPLSDEEFIAQAGADMDKSQALRQSVLGGETVKAMEEHERRIEEFEQRRVELAREGFEMRQDLQELESQLLEKALKERAREREKAAREEAKAVQAQYQAQQQGLQLAAQAVNLLDGQKQEAAFLSGLIATADAALHASHYDFFAAGQAALAATGYFTAAGKGSGGASSGAGGGGGGAAGGREAEAPSARRDADLLTARPNTRSDAPFIVIFDSNFAPSPHDADQIAETVRRANQNGGYG